MDKQFGAHLVSYVHTLGLQTLSVGLQTLSVGQQAHLVGQQTLLAKYISYNVVDDSGKKCKFVSNPRKEKSKGKQKIISYS